VLCLGTVLALALLILALRRRAPPAHGALP